MGENTLMATNNFKAFGIGAGANVTSQADYEALAALMAGFQSGKASSAQINKALRQSSTMAYVLAQFISDSASVDVLDNGTPATILANLKAGLLSSGTGRLIGVKVFSTAGTFTYTRTPGAKKARAYVTGAGGSGARGSSTTAPPGGGGGAGGTAIKMITLTQDTYNVVVGARALGGSPGGSSSFGTECAASGGGFATGGGGGAPGVGSGGDVNLSGGYGSDATDSSLGGYGSGDGGASYWGGGRKAGTGTGQSDYGAPGSGGGGNQAANTAGQNMGAPGIVYIEEYS